MLVPTKADVTFGGLLAQLLFLWTFPIILCTVAFKCVFALAAPYPGAYSEEREVWQHFFGGRGHLSPAWPWSQSLSSRHLHWKLTEMLSQLNIHMCRKSKP